MTERTTMKLKNPIEFGKEHIEELAFREPMAKDFRRLRVSDDYLIDTLLTLAGRLCGQPDAVIDKLAGDDLMEVFELVSGFMPGGLASGSEPSEA